MAGLTSLSSIFGMGSPNTLRIWIGKTLLKKRMPSLGPALMWPVLSSPAWRDAYRPATAQGLANPSFEAPIRDCRAKGVILISRQDLWDDLQVSKASLTNLVTCCSGRRPAPCQPTRGNMVLSYCYRDMPNVGAYKTRIALCEVTAQEPLDENALTSLSASSWHQIHLLHAYSFKSRIYHKCKTRLIRSTL
jgi:hypothetical protein